MKFILISLSLVVIVCLEEAWGKEVYLNNIAKSVQVHCLNYFCQLQIPIDSTIEIKEFKKKKGFNFFFKEVFFDDSEDLLIQKKIQQKLLKKITVQQKTYKNHKGTLISLEWDLSKEAKKLASLEVKKKTHFENNNTIFVIDIGLKNSLSLEDDYYRSREKEIRRKSLEDKLKINRKYDKIEYFNFENYCNSFDANNNNYKIKLLPNRKKIEIKKYFKASSFSEDYSYYEPKAENQESEAALGILKVFKETKNYGIVITLINDFLKKFPHSSLYAEMLFMRIDAGLKLKQNSPVLDVWLQELIAHDPLSQESKKAKFFYIVQLFEKEDYVTVSSKVLSDLKKNDISKDNIVLELMAAESFYFLDNIDEAFSHYITVLNAFTDKSHKADIYARIGDLFLKRFQYENAIIYYLSFLESYKDYVDLFPDVYINLGECYFQIEDYAKAKEIFSLFLEKYASSSFGWKATFKMSQIESIEKKLPQKDEIVRGWLLKTINNYPYSPGYFIARMSLLQCDEPSSLAESEAFMREKEVFVEGLLDLEKQKKDMPIVFSDIYNFAIMSHIKFLMHSRIKEKSFFKALDEHVKCARHDVKETISFLLNDAFHKEIMKLMEDFKYDKAVNFYDSNIELLPKKNNKISKKLALMLIENSKKRHLAEWIDTVVSHTENPEDITDEIIFQKSYNAWVLLKNVKNLKEKDLKEIFSNLNKIKKENFFKKKILIFLMRDKVKSPLNLIERQKNIIEIISLSSLPTFKCALIKSLEELKDKNRNTQAIKNIYTDIIKEIFSKHENDKDYSFSSDEESKILRLIEDFSIELKEYIPHEVDIFLGYSEELKRKELFKENVDMLFSAVSKDIGGGRLIYEYLTGIQLLKKDVLKAYEDKKVSEKIKKLKELKKDLFWIDLIEKKIETEKSNIKIKKYTKGGIV